MSNLFVNYYGEENQIEKLKEECIELAYAIQRYQANKGSLEDVKDEMADVENISGQLQEYWNDGVVFQRKTYKQTRQMERIKEEEEEGSNASSRRSNNQSREGV